MSKIESRCEINSDDKKCKMCEFSSKSKSGLKRHMTIKHNTGTGTNKCIECETNSASKHELMTHQELEHGFDLSCECCDYNCEEIIKMLNHEGSEHGLQCNQWDCCFTTKGSKYIPSELQILTEHINTNHGFKCNHCEDGFENS